MSFNVKLMISAHDRRSSILTEHHGIERKNEKIDNRSGCDDVYTRLHISLS